MKKKVKVLVSTTIETILELEISEENYKALDEAVMFETGGRYYSNEMAYELAHSENAVCLSTTEYNRVESHSLWRG